jgi:transcriptional regulator with XRE-family HTH domain
MQVMQVKSKNITSPEQNPMGIVKQLELYRLEHRITQDVLANEIGVNFSTVSRWFNGKTTPNKIQQYHIEKFLGRKNVSEKIKKS